MATPCPDVHRPLEALNLILYPLECFERGGQPMLGRCCGQVAHRLAHRVLRDPEAAPARLDAPFGVDHPLRGTLRGAHCLLQGACAGNGPEVGFGRRASTVELVAGAIEPGHILSHLVQRDRDFDQPLPTPSFPSLRTQESGRTDRGLADSAAEPEGTVRSHQHLGGVAVPGCRRTHTVATSGGSGVSTHRDGGQDRLHHVGRHRGTAQRDQQVGQRPAHGRPLRQDHIVCWVIDPSVGRQPGIEEAGSPESSLHAVDLGWIDSVRHLHQAPQRCPSTTGASAPPTRSLGFGWHPLVEIRLLGQQLVPPVLSLLQELLEIAKRHRVTGLDFGAETADRVVDRLGLIRWPAQLRQDPLGSEGARGPGPVSNVGIERASASCSASSASRRPPRATSKPA